ncbi:hypothetical protein NXS19_000157 [Fusarium pseudograminearum]|nr:hypothetical protein NXS19_000157 [Fusarium pseudograminearum]
MFTPTTNVFRDRCMQLAGLRTLCRRLPRMLLLAWREGYSSLSLEFLSRVNAFKSCPVAKLKLQLYPSRPSKYRPSLVASTSHNKLLAPADRSRPRRQDGHESDLHMT